MRQCEVYLFNMLLIPVDKEKEELVCYSWNTHDTKI